MTLCEERVSCLLCMSEVEDTLSLRLPFVFPVVFLMSCEDKFARLEYVLILVFCLMNEGLKSAFGKTDAIL